MATFSTNKTLDLWLQPYPDRCINSYVASMSDTGLALRNPNDLTEISDIRHQDEPDQGFDDVIYTAAVNPDGVVNARVGSDSIFSYGPGGFLINEDRRLLMRNTSNNAAESCWFAPLRCRGTIAVPVDLEDGDAIFYLRPVVRENGTWDTQSGITMRKDGAATVPGVKTTIRTYDGTLRYPLQARREGYIRMEQQPLATAAGFININSVAAAGAGATNLTFSTVTIEAGHNLTHSTTAGYSIFTLERDGDYLIKFDGNLQNLAAAHTDVYGAIILDPTGAASAIQEMNGCTALSAGNIADLKMSKIYHATAGDEIAIALECADGAGSNGIAKSLGVPLQIKYLG